jgi:penicillin-binding protein 2
LPGIDVCGKTGTAQTPFGKDNSIFIGFAPYHKPEISISVLVEHGGFGAAVAVPIARLMLEKYFKGEIAPENKFFENKFSNLVILPRNVI